MMLVLLYGHLGRRFGRVHRYAAHSPAEGLRAPCATLPGFRQALIEGGAYRVLRGGALSRLPGWGMEDRT